LGKGYQGGWDNRVVMWASVQTNHHTASSKIFYSV